MTLYNTEEWNPSSVGMPLISSRLLVSEYDNEHDNAYDNEYLLLLATLQLDYHS